MSALRTGTALAALFVLTACGGSAEPDTATPEISAQTRTDGTTATLPLTPIDVDSALGKLPAEIIETGPCPFLTDETAISGVTTKFDFTRRVVANDECIWNYNIGFEINVRIKPLADASPRSQRVYNLEIPPVIAEQSGPGTDAALFQDPTWDPANPRPYAFGFTLEGKDVMISTVGVKTTLAQLRSVADEIAAKLPTAPVIGRQVRQAVQTYDPCQLWSTGQVGAVFGFPTDAPTYSSAIGKTACNYGFDPVGGPRLKVQAGLFACGDDHISARLRQHFENYAGFDAPTVIKKAKEVWGNDISFEAQRSGYCISVISLENRDPVPDILQPALEDLMRNLLARTPSE